MIGPAQRPGCRPNEAIHECLGAEKLPTHRRHRPGVSMKLYTGVRGWGKNAMALNEKESNEEPIFSVDATQI